MTPARIITLDRHEESELLPHHGGRGHVWEHRASTGASLDLLRPIIMVKMHNDGPKMASHQRMQTCITLGATKNRENLEWVMERGDVGE